MGKEKDPIIEKLQFEARQARTKSYDTTISVFTKTAIISAMAGIITTLSILFVKDMIIGDEPQDITTQIENLDEISEDLKNLQVFIKNQKENLKEEGEALAKLEKRKEDLEPLVDLEEKAVNAILKEHQRSQNKRIWLERLISFFIGITTSAIATVIITKRQRKVYKIKVDGGSLD